MECDSCAFDVIEGQCNLERELKWYRFLSFRAQLGNCIHDLPTARLQAVTDTCKTKTFITNISSTDAESSDIDTAETHIQRISRLASVIVKRHRNTRAGPCHICNNSNTAAKF